MSPTPAGYLCLVLHGHLPFVRHPELPECLEEDWFFEAMSEVYLPLLSVLERLEQEGIGFKLTLNLSPTLTAMMQDPLLSSRYERHLEHLIRLAESECRRTQSQPQFAPLARMYQERFLWIRSLWRDTFRRDLVGAFRKVGRGGNLELITTAATHGFLPLMEVCESALRAQVRVGIESFKRAFGVAPSGFWLPECGYTPLADRVLAEHDIRYTFLETHGVMHAVPRPKFHVYAPVRSQNGLLLFGRDPETARQVWSSVEGYPGDEWYRDFYRDIGFDLEESYLKPFLTHGGLRVMTGMKYHRITGRTDQKAPYEPEMARQRAQDHAGSFFFNRERQVEHWAGVMDQPPVVVAMYDAELFGHWWFEGPIWLEELFRKFHANPSVIQMTTPSEIFRILPSVQEVSLHLSTWGWKGYNEMWLQGANAWVYRSLHRAAWRMEELAKARPQAQGLARRALAQVFRELFLAQSSDWAFILAQGTSCGYARSRLSRHLHRFTRLYEELQSGRIDEAWLSDIEGQDNLFPFLGDGLYA